MTNNDDGAEAPRTKRASMAIDGRLLFTVLGVVAPLVVLITALVQERFWIEKGDEQLATAFRMLEVVCFATFVVAAFRALFGRR